MRRVLLANLPANETCKEFAFSIQLPPCDGLEYATGIFAAMTEEQRKKFVDFIKKFQRKRGGGEAK